MSIFSDHSFWLALEFARYEQASFSEYPRGSARENLHLRIDNWLMRVMMVFFLAAESILRLPFDPYTVENVLPV